MGVQQAQVVKPIECPVTTAEVVQPSAATESVQSAAVIECLEFSALRPVGGWHYWAAYAYDGIKRSALSLIVRARQDLEWDLNVACRQDAALVQAFLNGVPE